MNNKIVNYVLVLDKSGSMSSFRDLTVSSVKEYVNTIKEHCRLNNIEGYLSILSFDTVSFEYLYRNRSVSEVELSPIDNYHPMGSTPLLDAMGAAVEDLQNDVGDDLGNPNRKILCSVFTDGEENASTKFTMKKTHDMVEILSENNQWEFTFQCAGSPETVKEFARKLSIAEENVQAFAATAEGFTRSYDTLRAYVTSKT